MKNFDINRIITCLIVGTILSGCMTFNPVYRTSYSFIPPKSPGGRECVNKCLLAKQMCQSSCEKIHNTRTANILINIGKEEKKGKHDFFDEFDEYHKREMAEYRREMKEEARYERCQNSCNHNHRLCHTNCGGEVIAKTVCIRNCDEEKK
ncbi:hypothetical protein [Neorickettsia sp. 179522]|uniref:hypothetical protein n=1 Tax=Neorickettsia sp. 179522 TaxID=1714371 RepID=UPI0009EDA0C1|nr:hypothetical protein [Neorickettsia sp. 179522]